ncbi:hypothetical protein E2C01_102418 [Portunus trituberculatus]|uniref:Uncharacterized protein n=1 Tax=Portunus trituberculatus TaxID=210409 RepID=A0A5B7KMS3_PORTR|nr:hypothetical protein [Portunus trituberculatus]
MQCSKGERDALAHRPLHESPSRTKGRLGWGSCLIYFCPERKSWGLGSTAWLGPTGSAGRGARPRAAGEKER